MFSLIIFTKASIVYVVNACKGFSAHTSLVILYRSFTQLLNIEKEQFNVKKSYYKEMEDLRQPRLQTYAFMLSTREYENGDKNPFMNSPTEERIVYENIPYASFTSPGGEGTTKF